MTKAASPTSGIYTQLTSLDSFVPGSANILNTSPAIDVGDIVTVVKGGVENSMPVYNV